MRLFRKRTTYIRKRPKKLEFSNRNKNEKMMNFQRLDENLKAEIAEKISVYFKKPAGPILKSFEEILEYQHLLTVYRLSYDELGHDIDIAILRSLLKAKKDNFKAQLKLCLTWNRIDIAKNFIFTDDKIWNVNNKVSLLKKNNNNNSN